MYNIKKYTNMLKSDINKQIKVTILYFLNLNINKKIWEIKYKLIPKISSKELNQNESNIANKANTIKKIIKAYTIKIKNSKKELKNLIKLFR